MSYESDSEDVLRPRLALAQDVLEYERMVRESVSAGQLLTAIEMARDGLARFGESLVLRQQLALALAQTGAVDAAHAGLSQLLKESADDEETLSLLGRVYKELWRRARTPVEATAALEQACKFYGDAYAKNEAYYPGINLAFILAAMGERVKAEECAKKVAKRCRAELAKAGDAPDGWMVATLAEALVHQGATTEAAKYYTQAAKIFAGRWRDLASMRRQAREILGFAAAKADAPVKSSWRDLASIGRRARELMGTAEKGTAWLDQCFEFPSVVVFSGHMIDAPGRASPRFPIEREAAIRERICLELKQLRAAYGYSSAACGGDIIFCECLLEMGAKVNLVLPCPVDAFKRQSVRFAGTEWEKRFHHVLANATTCLIANASEYATSDADPASSMALIYTNRIVTGLAVLQAQALDVDLQALALWDGKPGDGSGGTSSVVAEWEQRQIKPHIVRLEAPAGSAAGAGAANPQMVSAQLATAVSTTTGISAGAKIPVVPQEIKALVLAEVVNFKKIAEHQVAAYIHEFRGTMAGLTAGLPRSPTAAESSAGINFFAFDSLSDAARFALDLRDLIGRVTWAERGLPKDLGIRIVLHAGPVFAYVDPVLRRPTCLGAHVMRPTRITPMTPPGQIYVTQEFAALCGSEGVAALSFEFIGHLPMTRLFEDAPLYRLNRGMESSV